VLKVAGPFSGPSWEPDDELQLVDIDTELDHHANDMASVFARIFYFSPMNSVRLYVSSIR
jgi:hypothetical protein